MQDRFKFRIWDKKRQVIRDVWSVNPFGVVVNDVKTESYRVPLDDCVIMQCTGLKDKNGKLIFEGDIMKCLYISPIGEEISKLGFVEFNFGAFWFNYKIGSSYLYNENALWEIIGNIYENPELLEDK